MRNLLNQWLIGIVLATCVSGPGCSGGTVEERTLDGSVSLAVSGITSLDRIVLTISGVGIDPPLTTELAIVGGTASGFVGGIPAGDARHFSIIGYSGRNSACIGSADSDILPGDTAQIHITLSCQAGETGNASINADLNDAPQVTVTATPATVGAGDLVHLTAIASDPDGDAITYAWQADSGTFTNPTGSTTDWTAPAASGNYTLTVAVTDTQNSVSSKSVEVDVVTSGLTGSDVIVWNNDLKEYWVVDGASGALQRTFASPDGGDNCGFALLADHSGEYVLGCRTKALFYLRADRVVQTIDLLGRTVSGLVMHPSGNFAYVSASEGGLVVNTNQRDSAFNTVTPTDNPDLGGVFTPDGTRAYLLNDGYYGSISQLRVIDVRSATTTQVIQLPRSGYCYAGASITPDGTRLYAAAWCAQKLLVVDIDPTSPTYNTVVQEVPVSGEPRAIAFRPTGDYAYITFDTGGASVVATARSSTQYNQEVAFISGTGDFNDVHLIAMDLDGRSAFITAGSSGPNSLYVIGTEPASPTFNTLLRTYTVGAQPYVLAVRRR